MKKLNLIFTLVLTIFTLQNHITPGFAGRAAEQESAATQAAQYRNITQETGQPAGANGSTTCCPTGQNCQSNQTSTCIPPFYIQIQGGTSASPTILNTNTSTYGMLMLQQGTNVNNSFTYANCLLTVHIFPPSNSVTTTINPTSDNNYLIFYTLKNFAGDTVYKAFEMFKTSSVSIFPHYITIQPTQTTSQTTTNPTPAQFSSGVTGTFLPHSIGSSSEDKQKIINGLSPIVQNFLFTNSNNTINVTHISGAFGSEASSYIKSTKSSFFSRATAQVGADAIQPLNISFNDNGTVSTPTLTFSLSDTTPAIPFTATELATGLLLDVVIFPATYADGNVTGNYSVVATIKTLDGTKLRKKYSINSASYSNDKSGGLGTTLPTSITLSQGDATSGTPTTILTANILSSVANNSNYFNIISPLNLSFIISQPSSSQNLQILMI